MEVVNTTNTDCLPQSQTSDIVVFQHAWFQYGRGADAVPVLSNLTMRVPESTIYALLGPSGCGKTTLLKCIVGIKRIQKGSLYAMGKDMTGNRGAIFHRNIGYMPQDISLYAFFKIKEVFKYFGWVYGLSNDQIDREIRFLNELLDLPDENRFIKNLSGGEGRRISLAVALIHKPQLLILDEPTVGVDSLLRYKIWHHLKDLSVNEGTSVIITTHYIEEAIEAQCIGLMRKGRLLAESSPQSLMAEFNCSTLEETFLCLSDMDEKNIGVPERKASIANCAQDYSNDPPQPAPIFDGILEPVSNTSKMKATLMKNFYRSLRNPLLLIFIFAIPAFQAIFFCLSIGRPVVHLDVAVVNEEIMDLNYCPITTGCNFTYLSCRYLSFLDSETINQVPYSNIEDARYAFKRGRVWGVIHFERNASSALKDDIMVGLSIDDVEDDSDTNVWIEKSIETVKYELATKIYTAYKDFAMDVLKSCDISARSMEPKLRVEGIHGDVDQTYQMYVVPAITMSAIFILSIAPTAGSIINEKRLGLTQRSNIAGVSNLQICMSHLISEGVAMCIQITIILFSLFKVFGIHCTGNVFIVGLLIGSQGMCGMSFGVLISQICSLEQTTNYFALSICYPLLCVTGILWPTHAMPVWLQYISACLPLTKGVAAQRALFTKGFSFSDRVIQLGFLSNFTWVVIFLLCTVVLAKLKK